MKAPALVFAADPVLDRLLTQTVLPLAGFSVVSDTEFSLAVLAIGGGDRSQLATILGRFASPAPWPVFWIESAVGAAQTMQDIDRSRVQFFARPARLADLVRALCGCHPAATASEIYKIGAWAFAPRQRLLWREGDPVPVILTEKEALTLEYLRLATGRLVDRAELLESVWRYSEDMETHTIETHIYRLRQKLESNPAAPALLITEPGGYRLASSVKSGGA